MSISEDLNNAFTIVHRYEEYKFRKTWGLLLIITGIARFLLSFIINYSIVFSSGLDYEQAVFFARIFNLATEIALIIGILLIMGYYFFTTKKLAIKQGDGLISRRDYIFGLSLVILFYLTFVLRVMGTETYFEEVLAIFLVYFIIKIDISIKEILQFGIIFLGISIIDFICRYILIIGFYGTDLFLEIYMGYFLIISFIVLFPYIFFGYLIFKRAVLILEREQ